MIDLVRERFRTVACVAIVNAMAAAAFIVASAAVSQASAIPILTYHYDKARSGANTQETILTLANVNVSHFGKLFSVPVDSGIYAQPLYPPNLTIPGQGTHNVVYVPTQHNRLYALDADNGAPVWPVDPVKLVS